MPPPPTLSTMNLKLGGDGVHLETCPGQQRLGCVRVSFSAAQPKAASIIAELPASSSTFAKITTPASWGCSKGTYSKFETGNVAFETLITGEKDSNEAMTWILRIAGVMGAWFAVYCILSPIAWFVDKVGDVIGMLPCCGGCIEGLVEGVANTILCMISCSVGCSTSFLVIGLVWLYMRPLYGGLFFLVSLCCIGATCALGTQVANNRKGKAGSDFE